LNVDGGRCPVCKGTGFEEIDMMFMDNVVIPCDVCDGKKYRPEILEIQYKNKNINEILSMTVTEAMNFFVAHPNIRKPLSVLKEVGLDYLQLGQPANSLSGGESQRLKIAKELSMVHQKSTFYILDEPTTGLHFREVELLMKVLHKLIESGGSVVVVEHNLDVIRGSDYVIDLGPEAGHKGGYIVAEGAPTEIMKSKKSLTGQYLKRYLGNSTDSANRK
jgi:excinuclease ABC subunit A